MPPTLSISLPLGQSGLLRLFSAAIGSLGNNFYSFFVAVSGAVMGLQFQKLVEIQDECPIVLLYSASVGTGKYIVILIISRCYICN